MLRHSPGVWLLALTCCFLAVCAKPQAPDTDPVLYPWRISPAAERTLDALADALVDVDWRDRPALDAIAEVCERIGVHVRWRGTPSATTVSMSFTKAPARAVLDSAALAGKFEFRLQEDGSIIACAESEPGPPPLAYRYRWRMKRLEPYAELGDGHRSPTLEEILERIRDWRVTLDVKQASLGELVYSFDLRNEHGVLLDIKEECPGDPVDSGPDGKRAEPRFDIAWKDKPLPDALRDLCDRTGLGVICTDSEGARFSLTSRKRAGEEEARLRAERDEVWKFLGAKVRFPSPQVAMRDLIDIVGDFCATPIVIDEALWKSNPQVQVPVEDCIFESVLQSLQRSRSLRWTLSEGILYLFEKK